MTVNNMTFNITIYFSNGVAVENEVPLGKAVKLSMKENVLIPDDTDYVEIKGLNDSLIIPLHMTFVINKSPNFGKATDKISKYMLYKRDNGRCSYCGIPLSREESTIDHIIPRAQGGKSTWNNIALSCKKCNNLKDNRTPEQAKMKLLITPYNPKVSHSRGK